MCGHEYVAHLQGRVTQDSGNILLCTVLPLPFRSSLYTLSPHATSSFSITPFILPLFFLTTYSWVSFLSPPSIIHPPHPILSFPSPRAVSVFPFPPNPPFPDSLTPAASVEQCCLEAHHTNLLQAVINSNVHGVAMIRVDIGQGKKVRRTYKEVTVERMQAQTWEKERQRGGLG